MYFYLYPSFLANVRGPERCFLQSGEHPEHPITSVLFGIRLLFSPSVTSEATAVPAFSGNNQTLEALCSAAPHSQTLPSQTSPWGCVLCPVWLRLPLWSRTGQVMWSKRRASETRALQLSSSPLAPFRNNGEGEMSVWYNSTNLIYASALGWNELCPRFTDSRYSDCGDHFR